MKMSFILGKPNRASVAESVNVRVMLNRIPSSLMMLDNLVEIRLLHEDKREKRLNIIK